MSQELNAGSRIRFTHTLTEPPCEDHPGRLFAMKGETGMVIKADGPQGFIVKSDNWPNEFWASREEIEPVPAVVPTSAPLNDGKALG